MKKFIYSLSIFAVALLATTSCSPDFEGANPGSDGSPKATLYTYAPTSANVGYDADTDVRLRIAANSKTEIVYYKAMKTATREGMSEEQVINDVVSTGASIQNPGEGADVFLTNMQGDYTISAVAVNGSTKVLSETTFFGLTWNDICTGDVRTRFADGSTTAYGYIYNVVLQHNEDNPENYRLKNVFGTGVNIPITITTTHEEYGADGWANEGEADYNEKPNVPYHYALMAKTAVGLTYSGNGNELSVGDYYTVRGTDYTYYCRMYKDNYVCFYVYWTASTNVTSGWFEFYPHP